MSSAWWLHALMSWQHFSSESVLQIGHHCALCFDLGPAFFPVCVCVLSSCLPSLWLWLLTTYKRRRPQGRGSERVPEQPQLPGRLWALAGGRRRIHAFSRFTSFVAARARSALVQTHSHTEASNRRPGLRRQWVEREWESCMYAIPICQAYRCWSSEVELRGLCTCSGSWL